jgi:hypothetical protein
MTFVINFFKGFVVVLVAFLGLAIAVGNGPQVGWFIALGVLIVAIVTLRWQVPRLWIGSKITSIGVIAVALVALASATTEIKKAEVAEKEAAAAKLESDLSDLKQKDKSAYLARLRTVDERRWESEFESLDKVGYDKFVADRRKEQEERRRGEVTKLLQDAKALPPSETFKLHDIYYRLAGLEPGNLEFRKMREQFAKRLEVENNPKAFVTIENFSWTKGGFETVMIANFRIKNALPWPVKDIEVVCTHSAPSGTTIDENRRTIYEQIGPNSTKRVSDFNMGWIHNQASRSGCKVKDVVVIR